MKTQRTIELENVVPLEREKKVYWKNEYLIYPFGTLIFAPSKMACDNWKSSASAATVAARNASHISFRPSNAGAVSQNSSRFERSWPSVSGTSDFQRIVSWHNGWFLRGGPPFPPIKLPDKSIFDIIIDWSWVFRFISNRNAHDFVSASISFSRISNSITQVRVRERTPLYLDQSDYKLALQSYQRCAH